MKFTGFILGFFVFILMMLVFIDTANYMVSGSGFNSSSDIDSEDVTMLNEIYNTNVEVHSGIDSNVKTIYDYNPAGELAPDNPVDVVTSGGESSSGWGILPRLDGLFTAPSSIVQILQKYYGEYIPVPFWSLFIVAVVLPLILMLISAVLRNRIE